MKITEVTVSAGRTFNHPYESYSNFRPEVTLKATIQEGEDPDKIVADLQAKAERMAEDCKNNMLTSIEEIRTMREYEREIANLERSLKQGQDRLNEIRKNRQQTSRMLPIPVDDTPEEHIEPER